MNTMTNPFRVDDKVALVTGAGRGIGAACAHALAAAGAKVLVTDIESKYPPAKPGALVL